MTCGQASMRPPRHDTKWQWRRGLLVPHFLEEARWEAPMVSSQECICCQIKTMQKVRSWPLGCS